MRYIYFLSISYRCTPFCYSLILGQGEFGSQFFPLNALVIPWKCLLTCKSSWITFILIESFILIVYYTSVIIIEQLLKTVWNSQNILFNLLSCAFYMHFPRKINLYFYFIDSKSSCSNLTILGNSVDVYFLHP